MENMVVQVGTLPEETVATRKEPGIEVADHLISSQTRVDVPRTHLNSVHGSKPDLAEIPLDISRGSPSTSDINMDQDTRLSEEIRSSIKTTQEAATIPLETYTDSVAKLVVATPPNITQMCQRVKSLISLDAYDEEMWTSNHESLLCDFLTSPTLTKLVVFVDESTKCKQLNVQTSLPTPSSKFKDLMYFIRDSSSYASDLTDENFEQKVQYGCVSKNTTEGLLRLMQGVYVPMFLDNKRWPDSVRKDFNSQLHKFMAFLTDTTFQIKGHTVLYVPKEDISKQEGPSQVKDVIQRLESLLIHWTRQIKEVVNNQHTSETTENAGPLEEIQFWSSRCDDLSGISEQLNRTDVQRIIHALDIAKSSYIEQFHRLSNLIQEGKVQAQDNLKFLLILRESCQLLSKEEPKNISAILPNLLNCIRIIWSNSKYYNTKERLTSLMRKESMCHLQDSINCGESWKHIYKQTSTHIAKHTKRSWDLDQSSIFAQIDAFVQRCRDLLEVCEGQIQFTRKLPNGKKAPLPFFGGSCGPEITKSLEDIEVAFEKLLSNLWSIRKHILDVKATRWHDDYNNFKQGVKDLEVRMQNVIVAAFERTMSVETGVELLDIFHHLAKREAIKRTVEKKHSDVYQILLQELNAVKIEFESHRKTPDVLRSQPDYAGSAYWARALLKRIRLPMNSLLNAYYLPHTVLADEAKVQFEPLAMSLEEYISKTHTEWIGSLGTLLTKKLDSVLMSHESGGLLAMNFDKDLFRLFGEISYFQKLKCDIPFHVQEIYSKKEELRILRENVLLVVRDYNTIIETLTSEQHLIFKERIRFLDRKINPGVTNLTWSSKGITEFFVKECRRHSHDIQKTVIEFLEADKRIQLNCHTIAQTPLWKIENKHIYDLEEFESSQKRYQEMMKMDLISACEDIKKTLDQTYETFRNDGKEVYSHWIRYIERVDVRLEDALRTAVRRSLLEISKAINGEGKNRDGAGEVHPLFKVNVILDLQKVDFSPTLQRLEETVNKFVGNMVSTIGAVVRLGQSSMLDSSYTMKSRVYDVISNEEDITKIISSIHVGMSSNSTKCQSYLRNWDSFREIWEINKDAFIRRYAKLKPSLSTFDADINRYNEVANNTQKEETLTNVNFIRLDCSPLKQALVSHCSLWQNTLTALLNTNAATELTNLHKLFAQRTKELTTPPKDLERLGESLTLLIQLQNNVPAIESQFSPLQEMYEVLDKYEVQIKEEERVNLESLPLAWISFKQMIVESERSLHETKAKFKADLLSSIDEFSKQTANSRDDLNLRGPFSSSFGVDRALKSIADYRAALTAAEDHEKSLKKGLAVFKIEQAPSKDIEMMAIDLDSLTQVWQATQEWNMLYEAWRSVPFITLDSSEIEESVQKFVKRLSKMTKEAKNWDVYINLKDRVSQTKRSLPLLLDLRNPAIRDRHWNQIIDDIGKTFTAQREEFTLDNIFELGMDQHTDFIATVSASATKELSIEQGLLSIKEAWLALDLDIVPYKEEKGYFKIKSTEELFELLEDNQVTLSSMKASKYFLSFQDQVDNWERTLTHIMEAIEILLVVQRQWIYLENIFVGAEDIRKQLPKESAVFDSVNSSWGDILKKIHKDRNVLRATHIQGLLQTLTEMNSHLEKIQKSLDMYLETKRQAFPRFYFLSNDDLLEILGQAKDPNSVQPHLKKCFDNIHKLELAMAGSDGRRYNEALGMHSGDGEYVQFHTPVVVEGPIEIWLLEIEAAMRTTLRKLLPSCLNNLKKAKRDKWFKDWAGMLLISAALVSWTSECTKALQEIEKGEKTSMKILKKRQISSLKRLADLVRSPLGKLSKQDHYDFGLRALTSALRSAGSRKRMDLSTPDDSLLFLALRDSNISKLTTDDIPLFLGILSDLFPGVEISPVDYSELRSAIIDEIKGTNLLPSIELIRRLIGKYISQALDFRKSCTEVVCVSESSAIRSFCKLFDSVAIPDTVRNEFIIRSLANKRCPVLLVGDIGTGKTSLIHNSILTPEINCNRLVINMSAQTSAYGLQSIIEGNLEKRTKNIFVPIGGKDLLTFIDDFNMPLKDEFGSQPALEFIRHLMDYGFCYDRQKKTLKYLNDIYVTAAMGPPGGGRNSLCPRVQSRFNVLNMTFPSEISISRIFGSIINQKLQDFEESVKPLGDIITHATIDIYNMVASQLLPTPSKIHYLFNLRDISKVFQGLLRANREYYDSRDSMTKLWVHELLRVFNDRLVNKADCDYFMKLVDDKLGCHFNTSLQQLCGDKRKPLFVDFLGGSSENPLYKEINDQEKLKRFMIDKLTEYNSEPGFVQVDLVLFYDAMEHICRITRVLRQPCGNVFLIGVGGSGRQSLARLASYIVDMAVVQIQITKNYRHSDFREDLKKVYLSAGLDDKPTTFLFTDTQITSNIFLEDISNILSSGEVPNMFTAEEQSEISQSLQSVSKTGETGSAIYNLFTERARRNLHIVLYHIKRSVSQMFVTVHTSVVDMSLKMISELKRYNFVTPTNYLELVTGYRELLCQKRGEIGDSAQKLKTGLSKLDDTRLNVEQISAELEVSKKQVSQYQRQCEDFLVVIIQQKRESDEQAKSVTTKAERLGVEEEEVRAVAEAAQEDLDQAMPALSAAVKALEAINKKDLNEIRSYGKPPPLVEKVMEAIMVLKKCEPTWEEAKRQIGNPYFIKQLINFDKDNISDKILKRISQYCADENFQPEAVGRVSGASKSLCMWVRAMETYGTIFRHVAPKKEKLRVAQETLEKKQKTLREAKSKLQEIQEKLIELKAQYDEKVSLKEKLRQESEQTELKLSRAEKLVSGLSGERSRWEKSICKYEEALRCLPGDCLLASAFFSYAGPFTSIYRQSLAKGIWLTQIRALEIPFSPEFSFDGFLGKAIVIRDWNSQGLPGDAFSTENADQVNQQLVVSEQTEKRIDAAREGYRPAAQRTSILYFVLNDLGSIDPMYQFSLDAYIELFEKSMARSKKYEDINERIISLNDYHTYLVYKNICRGLFEKHKILFSLQMTVKIMEANGKLNREEYDFLLRGGQVLNKDSQPENSCTEWITDKNWDNLTELDRIPALSGIVSSIEQSEREWKAWFSCSEPNALALPGDWENKLNDLQKMLIVKSLRPDRIPFCASTFISNNLGQRFIEPPILDMLDILGESSPKTPLIFVLSAGVDPTASLLQLAKKKNMSDRFHFLSLGQGQAPKATRMIQDALRDGSWVFLANCHLSISWMSTLDKIIESIPDENPHPDFRLWLSSSPHSNFPISILQCGLKMTTEPPKGLKANLTRLFNTTITEDSFSRCTNQGVYQRLIFSLSFFHSILLERKKFQTLGWNVVCDFSDSDFDICENIMVVLLDEYEDIPWEALKYLIAEANYGGRVTDDWDRRVLRGYINQLFNDDIIKGSPCHLTTTQHYFIPESTDLTSYREYISTLPNTDRPEIFGQHPNADIASQTIESGNLLDTLISLQPQIITTSGISREEKVLGIAADILKRIPEDIDYEATLQNSKHNMGPFNVVLLKEIRVYNDLLQKIRKTLLDLQNGIQGIVVMSPKLEDALGAIYEGKVPLYWSKAYASLKPLSAWIRDLTQRIEFFSDWSKGNEPKQFWLGAFTFPTGVLTACLQREARKGSIPVDILTWEFLVLSDDEPITTGSKEGIYVKGLYLEGARKNGHLVEPKPMELIAPLPTIQFKPIEARKKANKGVYVCPLYYFSVRSGTREHPSFIIAMELKAGLHDQEFWVKRGTAALASLS
ncbi:hypothetical protein BSLG_000778 [Batrachochytrium salamandrivorans]|nr:hypothetical protein BSLG_000778 [Batrachochytrium salamandrivorans]